MISAVRAAKGAAHLRREYDKVPLPPRLAQAAARLGRCLHPACLPLVCGAGTAACPPRGDVRPRNMKSSESQKDPEGVSIPIEGVHVNHPPRLIGMHVPILAQVCARFRPCLHNFFLETFRGPAAWFEARLAYTRATAVSSMAGYLIGLGDRHSANILLDRRSAQVPCL